VTYSLRHDELAVFLWKVIGTEQEIPEDEFYSIIAGVAIALRDIGGMMPTMHLWCNE
jgi:hypothetical protein